MTSVLSSSGVGGVTGDMTMDEPDFVSSKPVTFGSVFSSESEI